MTDREETVRIDAIRAVEQMEGEEAALLLRLKAASGTNARSRRTGAGVTAACRGCSRLDFARSFLERPPRAKPP